MHKFFRKNSNNEDKKNKWDSCILSEKHHKCHNTHPPQKHH
jgi:hypothetical protein